ncbi:psiA family protein [Escherichia coli P0304816.12]|nr:psiA family protein [Escherichia coli P0304816.12]
MAETEKRRHQGNTLAEYPYAGAFFRCLNGSRRISLSDLRFFMPSLTAEELHGNRLQWLYAIDVLIETQGEVCLLPLPGDAAERCSRRSVRSGTQSPKSRWSCRSTAPAGREAEQKARAYQALVLRLKSNWHSIPGNSRKLACRWSDRVAEHDLETLFWQWGSVFRHWPEWNAGSGRICHSGRSSRKPVWQQERPVTLSVRWSDGWCRTNSGRQRDAATITRISRERSE